MNNFRPISNLPVLSKILESLVATQLKSYLHSHYILNEMQSGFRSGHSTIKVMDDFKEAIDNKFTCVSLFIDLTKAFDTVDHLLLVNTLLRAGIGCNAVK